MQSLYSAALNIVKSLTTLFYLSLLIVCESTIPVLRALRELTKSFLEEYCTAGCNVHRQKQLIAIIRRFTVYINETGIRDELSRGILKFSTVWVNLLLLIRIQQSTNNNQPCEDEEIPTSESAFTRARTKVPRWRSLYQPKSSRSSEGRNQEPRIPTMKEAHRFAKFATAAYGPIMVNAHVKPRPSLLWNPAKSFRDAISRYNSLSHISTRDMVVHRQKEHLDYTDHNLVVDHKRKEAILSIRGTFSIADALADIDIEPVDFCGGLAPSGFVTMATNIWKQIEDSVRTKVIEPNYNLVVVGHSLGGAIAMLLTMKVLHENKHLTKIHCHAFGAPPVFSGDISATQDVLPHITAYIHENDCVPFLQPHTVCQVSASLATIDKARECLGWFELLRDLVWSGAQRPAIAKALEAKQGSSFKTAKSKVIQLEWPVQHVIWLRNSKQTCEAIVCDPKKLIEQRGLRISSSMLTDHLVSKYEDILRNLVDRGAQGTCRLPMAGRGDET